MSNDLHVALSGRDFTGSDPWALPLVEVVIGGWQNKASVIRSISQRTHEQNATAPYTMDAPLDAMGVPIIDNRGPVVNTDGFLSINEARKFWIWWRRTGELYVGRGHEVGKDEFMSVRGFPVDKVNYYAVNSWDVPGTYTVCPSLTPSTLAAAVPPLPTAAELELATQEYISNLPPTNGTCTDGRVYSMCRPLCERRCGEEPVCATTCSAGCTCPPEKPVLLSNQCIAETACPAPSGSRTSTSTTGNTDLPWACDFESDNVLVKDVCNICPGARLTHVYDNGAFITNLVAAMPLRARGTLAYAVTRLQQFGAVWITVRDNRSGRTRFCVSVVASSTASAPARWKLSTHLVGLDPRSMTLPAHWNIAGSGPSLGAVRPAMAVIALDYETASTDAALLINSTLLVTLFNWGYDTGVPEPQPAVYTDSATITIAGVSFSARLRFDGRGVTIMPEDLASHLRMLIDPLTNSGQLPFVPTAGREVWSPLMGSIWTAVLNSPVAGISLAAQTGWRNPWGARVINCAFSGRTSFGCQGNEAVMPRGVCDVFKENRFNQERLRNSKCLWQSKHDQ